MSTELKELIDNYLTTTDDLKSIRNKTVIEAIQKENPEIVRNDDLKKKICLIHHNLTEEPKCECGAPLQFVSQNKASIVMTKFGGFREFCSRLCMQKSSSIFQKRANTNLERFGETSYAKTEMSKQKSTQKWDQEKKNTFNEKRRETQLEKYGVDHFSKTKEYLQKRENTCLETYGVTNTFQLREKVVEGQKKKFNGKVSWLQTEEGKLFMQENQPMSNPQTIEKSRLTRYEKELSHVNPDLLDAIINRNKDKFKTILEPLWESKNKCRKSIAIELGVSYSTLCRYIRNFELRDDFISPIGAPSLNEREIYEFVKQLCPDAVHGDRTILKGKELDIYIPSKNLAIEHDGLYWHSEYNGMRDSHYHVNKTNECERQGISLLHIFENEWNEKQEIWKSIIKQKLSMTENKIYARNCNLEILTPQIAREFLEKNHLSGFLGATFHHGLYHNNELVSVMSIGESRFDKTRTEYEIIRFASKLNTTVIGGMSKLFKSFNLDKPIICFADRRLSSVLNSSYNSIFNTTEITNPNWWGFHTSDYILQHRLSFTREKLKLSLKERYNDDISSFDNMIANNMDRIWDCGNIKFYNNLENTNA